MRKGITLIAFTLVACSTPSSVAPLSIPLQYKMMAEPIEFPLLSPCGALSNVEVVDARADKAIGKRYVEDKTSEAAVTASTDVVAWARSGIDEALKRSGVAMGKPGAPVLRVTIDQINTLENVLRRSGYEGRINLSAELRSADGKTSCWKDHADGSAENYGYPGSVENYQETLNHALDRALIRLLSAQDLKRAVCTSCG